jgi:TonB family protein
MPWWPITTRPTVLRALQRTGDMSYPGQLTGETLVRTLIGSKGDLVALRLVNSSGSDELDRAAEQIVRQTAPFPPFPAELEVQTSSRKLIVNMRFEGSKDLVPRVGRAAIAGVMDRDWLS